MKNYPKIYNNDIKVLGRVVSIATENKVAAAELVFDEKFDYLNLDSYSWDNIDLTQVGLDQYTINRLFGKKLKKFDDAFQFDEDGWLLELKVRNLIADNATINNKLTTKDLEVTNNATIKNLHVTENSTFDGDVTIGGNLIVNNKNMGDLIEQILRVIGGDDKTSEIWRVIQDHERRIQTLEACCDDMHNNPTGGVSLDVNPDPIDITVGDPDVAFTVTPSIGLAGNYTAQIVNTSVATLVGGKVHAVTEGNTQLKIDWQGIQKTVLINVSPEPLQTFRVTFNPNNGNPNFHQDVQEGNRLVAVTDPTKEGYTFNGWHRNSDTGAVWNFNDPVTSTMMLIAGYTQNEQPVEPIRPESISISGPNSVQVGNTITLTATITPSNADTDTAITWNSSDASKATVDNGVVTGVAEGPTTITARTANGKTASHQVTVIQEPQSEYRLIITALSDKRDLLLEETVALTATIVNTLDSSDTKTEQITWTSSDSALSVSSTGQMTANATANSAIANVTVTATSASGLTDQLTFVITDPTVYPETVTVSPETIHVGENKSLNVVVAPSNAAYSLTYESADTSIFTVSNNGFITGVSAGSANVTVRTLNGKTSSAAITVIPAAIVPNTITVNGAIPLYIGSGVDAQHPNTCELTAVVGPEGASLEVHWEAAYPTIANVSSTQPTTNGITVTAISVGTTRIYAHSTQSEVVGYTDITVTNIDAPEPLPETSLIIEPVFPNNTPNGAWGYDLNDNLQLSQRTSGLLNAYVINNTTGTKSPVEVTWSSSIEDVRIHAGGLNNDTANTGTGTFTLFGSDLVNPSAESVTITATSNDYGSASKVVKMVRSGSEPWPFTLLELNDMTMTVGDIAPIDISTWRPNMRDDGKQTYGGTYDTSDGELITTPLYISSDESVFTIDLTGLISAVGVGEATVTMKTYYLNTDFDIRYSSVNHVAETWEEGVSATATITVTDVQSDEQTEP